MDPAVKPRDDGTVINRVCVDTPRDDGKMYFWRCPSCTSGNLKFCRVDYRLESMKKVAKHE